jgi:predicted nucleotidyltransferase
MNRGIPVEIQALLDEYLSRLERDVPGVVKAFYLVGSMALGGFNPRLSDVDFVAILDHPASEEEFARLRSIHQVVERALPRWKLEGIYIQEGNLGCRDEDIRPYINYHDGLLKRRDQHVLSLITWWILKNRGIPVIGQPPQTLPIVIDWDELRSKMHENLNTYWASWTTQPKRMIVLLSDFGVEWTVLGTLRQIYTLCEHSVTTKVGAGEWGLEKLPERWHKIILEAIRIREGKGNSPYRTRLSRALEAREFINYVIGEANKTG